MTTDQERALFDKTQLIAWLQERHDNAQRLGVESKISDRRGWEEDADYFRRAIQAIEYSVDLEEMVELKQKCEIEATRLKAELQHWKAVAQTQAVRASEYAQDCDTLQAAIDRLNSECQLKARSTHNGRAINP